MNQFITFSILAPNPAQILQRGSGKQARKCHKPAANFNAVNKVDAAKMAANYIVEKLREIQLFSEVSVSHHMQGIQ